MKLTDMELTHSVELEILHDGRKTTLLTSVETIIKNNVLLTPIHIDGKIVGFPAKFTVNLLYPEDGQVFCWSDVTVKAVRHHTHIYHMVELHGHAEVLNRRGAYRVFIGENMNVLKLTASGAQLYEVYVRDISETGTCFMSKAEFTVGRNLRLQIRFKSGQELSLRCQVIWKRENPNRKTTFLYGCRFTEKNKVLNSYLMNVQQAKQRKKMGL